MDFETYESRKTLKVFQNLGYIIIFENEYVYYLYQKELDFEIFLDKTIVKMEILEENLIAIKLKEEYFDSLYNNL